DASNRDQCEVKRLRTNTPLQALVMMNDPQVNEAARVLAERLCAQSSISDQDRILTAFRQILCRAPKDEEFDLLMNSFEAEREKFANHPADAEKIIDVGEYPHEEFRDRASLAALVEVIMTLYNMEEAIVRT